MGLLELPMSNGVKLSIPPSLDRQAILSQLDAVLDPELDESILSLGLVKAVSAQRGHLTVELELPTYWCAANFSFLMASDTRRNLLGVDGVRGVTVRLPGHFAAQAIEAGVNSGKSFAESFPGEAWEDLEQLRDLFLRKGYTARQERFIRQLRYAGFSYQAMSFLKVADLRLDAGTCWVHWREGHARHGAPASLGPTKVAQGYLKRRAELGLDCSPDAPLLSGLNGIPIAADQLESFFIQARTARVSAEATGSLCSALLQARKAGLINTGSAKN